MIKVTRWGLPVRGNTARAVTRTYRAGRGAGKLPDPYKFRRPVYKKDLRLARQAAAARAAQARGDAA